MKPIIAGIERARNKTVSFDDSVLFPTEPEIVILICDFYTKIESDILVKEEKCQSNNFYS